MTSKSKISEYLKVFNPFEYKNLIKHQSKKIFNFYFVFILISLILFLIILLPKAIYLQNNVGDALSSFDKLKIDLDSEANSIIKFSDYPSIIIALNDETVEKSNILITDETVKLSFWPIEKEYILKEYSNLKNRSDSMGALIGFIFLLILPGIIVLFGIIQIILSIIVSLIYTVFGLIFVRFFKKDIAFKKLFKIAILSSAIFVLFNSIFIPLLLNIWFPLILYLLLFLSAALISSNIIGNESNKSEPKEKKSVNSSAKKRNKEIFKSKSKSKSKKDDDFIMLD